MLTTTKTSRHRLRKLMADRGLKAHEVAKVIGVRPQTVRAYMCGSRAFPKHYMAKVQAQFGGTP